MRDSSGTIIYDPIIKLDSLLKAKPENLPAIVFQHSPVTDDFYQNAFHAGWPVEKRTCFQKLCESYNVVAVICGHFHRDDFQWIGKIPQFVSSPITGTRGRQPYFRIYHFKDGKISFSGQYL